jgi:hypothetical protein
MPFIIKGAMAVDIATATTAAVAIVSEIAKAFISFDSESAATSIAALTTSELDSTVVTEANAATARILTVAAE